MTEKSVKVKLLTDLFWPIEDEPRTEFGFLRSSCMSVRKGDIMEFFYRDGKLDTNEYLLNGEYSDCNPVFSQEEFDEALKKSSVIEVIND